MSVTTAHRSILLERVVTEVLGAPVAGPRWLIDCTLGGGGHTAGLLAQAGPEVRVLALDRDRGAVERGAIRFAQEIERGRLVLRHSPFSKVAEVWRDCRGSDLSAKVSGVIADFGFSSDQIEAAERGLSFQLEGPLDMRLDTSTGETAAEVLDTLSEAELADVFFHLGEERYSRRIARRLADWVREKGRAPATTRELADLVSGAVPPDARHGRIHPATRVFQALRIYVNDELGELDRFFAALPDLVVPGGRVAVLTFHSLEDRRAKTALFRDREKWEPLTKKPIEPGEQEISQNPRARSAKLRITQRV